MLPRKKRKRRLGSVERDILNELSLGDVMYGFFLSARSSSRMMRLARERANNRYRRKQTLDRLVREGYVSKSGEHCSITKRGMHLVGAAVGKTRAMLGKKTWDKKWRMVAFDIPQEHGPVRGRIRGILRRAGFVKLQQSIWVFPHECQELVQLLQEETHLARHILYGVLERVEGEQRLMKVFNLR